MMTDVIISIIFGAITTIISFIPAVTELPFGIDNFFSTAVGYFQRFIDVFPPFGVLLEVFTFYLLMKLTFVTINFVLGARSPTKFL